MQKINRIVALLDFSECSKNVLKFVNFYAEILEAQILLLHQIPKFIVPSLADETTRQEVENFEKQKALTKLRNFSLEVLPGKKSEFKVSEQDLLVSLDDLNSDGFQNWLFIGIKEKKSWTEKMIGSTVHRIINNGNFLTLALPHHADLKVTQQLTLAFSYNYLPNREVLTYIINNLNPHLKKLEFMSIVTKNDDETKAINFISELKNHYEQINDNCSLKIFKGKDAFEEVEIFMKERHSILVVQKGSRKFTDQLFRKFFINDLVASGSIPLLVLPQ